jgi:hypothetical protein
MYFGVDDAGVQVLPHILDQVLENFDATKNPGSPLCFKFPTNAGLKTVRNELFDVVEERLRPYFTYL